MAKNDQAKDRKLTPREERRMERFAAKCATMEEQGFVRHDLTVSVVKANVFGLLSALPLIVLATWLFFWFVPEGSVSIGDSEAESLALALLGDLASMLLWFLVFLALIVVHELIHGLTWGLFAPNHFKSVEFGVIWQMLTPYCTCGEPLKRWQYVVGAAMPTIVLGGILTGAAVATGNLFVFLLALGMILGGGGDILIILKLLTHKAAGKEVVYIDHPTECGLVAFER